MIDIAKIERIMDLMTRYGFDVVQAEHNGEKIALARNVTHMGVFSSAPQSSASLSSGGGQSGSSQTTQSSGRSGAASSSAPNMAVVAQSVSEAAQAAAEAAKIPDGTVLKSPFVGTFYRSPSPDSPSFVDMGTRVKKGQTLCIVEAMKLMNEIESEVDGEIKAILVENGKPVEFGTPLFIIG